MSAVSCGPGVDPDAREALPLERAYVGLAVDLEDPGLCAKISDRATDRAPFNSPGTRVTHTRSVCYFYLATRLLDVRLCEEVRARTPRAGRRFRREACIREVMEGRAFRASLGFDHEVALRALGYADEDRLATRDSLWVSLYYEAAGEADFRARLADLPDFSQR